MPSPIAPGPKRVLLVDDDSETTHALNGLLSANGFVVEEENDSMHALDTARKFHPDFVILDFLMPRAHGGDVAWQLASDSNLKAVPIVLCSGVPTSEFALKLPPTNIAIMEKPVDSEALLHLLQTVPGEA